MGLLRSAFIDDVVNFRGRISRRDFWMTWLYIFPVSFLYFFVFYGILSFAVYIGGHVLVFLSAILMLFIYLSYMYLCLASVSLNVRRLHDIGKSGWWMLLTFVPVVGPITIFVFTCLKGTDQAQTSIDTTTTS